MSLGYGDYMECIRYMNEACISGKCPYYGKGVTYCCDCEYYIEVICKECLFYHTPDCIKEGS